MSRITISGRIPSKKNSKIMVCFGKTPRLLPSAKHTQWHKDASLQLKPQIKEKYNSDYIELHFWLPDNRKTDLTNKAESVMDLLVDNGFLEDDCWQITGQIRLIPEGIDKDNPRCEIDY